jgi:hypothetical protein
VNESEAIKLILDTLVSKQGCKATELVSVPEIANCGHDPIDLISTLVAEGKITEIEYTLPGMEYRLKSFYLPGGSKIKINQPV